MSRAAKRSQPVEETDITADFEFTKHDVARCKDAPTNMVCITGQRETTAGNFYVDREVVTQGEYNGCLADNACTRNPFAGDETSPVLWLDYASAHAYCTWAGKRLPTEAELALAWLDDDVSAGSHPEWTNDWATTDREECGPTERYKLCKPKNRMGICSGIFPCSDRFTQKRILSDEGPLNMNAAARSKIAFRCVSETPYLTNQPPWMIAEPPPELKDPEPLSKSDENKIQHLAELDSLDKPNCKVRYGATADCKDPASYFAANEDENYVFLPYIRNLGGAYAGLAADANYSYIAAARSRVAWLFDYDANILALHRIIRTFILESESIEDFIACFSPRNREESLELLTETFWEDEEIDTILEVFQTKATYLFGRYLKDSQPKWNQGHFGWLRFADQYDYIRLLYTQNRIAIVPGDLRKGKTLRSVGKAARSLGLPLRVYYASNAEEFWSFNENFRKNILSLPFDEASVALRSIHEYKWHRKEAKGFTGFWHYVVHGAYNYQKKMLLPHYMSVDQFKMHRVMPRDKSNISTIEVPSRLPEGMFEKGWYRQTFDWVAPLRVRAAENEQAAIENAEENAEATVAE